MTNELLRIRHFRSCCQDRRPNRAAAVLAAVALCLVSLLVAPLAADDGTSAARMAETVKYLASDALQGRGVGTDGIQQAAAYLADQFAGMGLETQLQSFEVVTHVELGPAESNRLTLQHSDGQNSTAEPQPLELAVDYNPLAIGGSGTIDADLVFAGYGITATRDNYDDYAGIDVDGKVVVLLRKEPQQNDESSVFGGRRSSRHAYFTTKVANAYEHGAAAVVLVNDYYSLNQSRQAAQRSWNKTLDEVVAERRDFLEASNPSAEERDEHDREIARRIEQLHGLGERLKGNFDEILEVEGAGQESSHPRLPVFFARRDRIDAVVRQVAGKDLVTIEREIDEGPAPQSFPLNGWRLKGESLVIQRRADIKNVVAVLEGSGPQANETVVLGAHYDHLGLGGAGAGSLAPWTKEIHNGADDNASGTAALLEIARQLAGAPQRPARRLVFIAFAGEERGLLGSAYYVANPIFPLERTVAMVNMDMVGRLNNNKLIVYGTGTAAEFDGLIDQLNEQYRFDIRKEPGGFGPSDHASFYGKKIPVLHFFTDLHSDYHRPSDDFEKINLSGMQRIALLVTSVVQTIAAGDAPPEYREVARARRPRGGDRGDQRPYFGSIPEFGREVEGYALMGVTEDSPAQRAGLVAGDVIVRFGDSRIGGLEDFDSALRKYQAGDRVPVVVMRDDQRIELTVTLDPPR